MDKRYQVFISSTFADLEEERKGVMEAIIELNCFPAGMEMFPASNMEQLEYIKSVIDESDYYVIIVAGRYGSVADDGISYTEKEFDYASEQGIPILAFVKNDIDNLPATKYEQDPDKRERLANFRDKVLNGRLAKFWDTSENLKYNLHSSLAREMKINPRIGWIRADSSSDIQVYKTIENLKQDNNRLRTENERLLHEKNEEDHDKDDLSMKEFDKKINSPFCITIENDDHYHSTVKTTISKIIKNIGYRLMYPFDYDTLSECIAQTTTDINSGYNLYVCHNDMQQIIMKMLALNLIEINSYEPDDEMDTTEFGRKIILSMIQF